MDDETIIKTANTILSQLTVPRRVSTIHDVNADMFITLYEGLCGETIPDVILPSNSEEDDVHNMQCVIDSLAMDVLHTSLAHIIGQDVVRGRRMSIMNLLDIFSGLLEYILDGIEKDDSANEAERSEDSKSLDAAAEQTVLSDAVRGGFTDKTNRPSSLHSSDDNTEALIALGDEKKYLHQSPTASPSSKKSRKSGEGRTSERRRSKRVTPHAVSQPMASSSMHSIHPSCTESESDASTKPTAGKALDFSKVPADFSPPKGQTGSKQDETFTKPSIPPQRKSADKIAGDILKTGESTRELIALGDTPVLRTRTRSATRSKPTGNLTRAFTTDKPPVRGELNKSNNAARPRAVKRSRPPKRHVSFVSDRTANDDTLADLSTHMVEEPRRVASEPYRGAASADAANRSPERHDLSSRLVDYFDRKEAGAGDRRGQSQQNVRLSPLYSGGARPKHTEVLPPSESDTPITESTEYQTAIEKSASLYDRVKALRNAASDKLETIRSESAASGRYDTAMDSLSSAPVSDGLQFKSNYGRTELDTKAAQSDSQTATSKYLTAMDPAKPSRMGSAPALSDYRTARSGTDSVYETARQSNVPDLSMRRSPREISSAITFSRPVRSTTTDYTTAGTRPRDTTDYLTAQTNPSTDYRTASTGDLASSRRYQTAQFDGLTTQPAAGAIPSRTSAGDVGDMYRTNRLDSDYRTASEQRTDYATELDRDHLRFIVDDRAPLATGYKRPEWRYKLPPSASASQTGSEGGKRVRFNRPTTRASTKATKTKSQSMLDAVRRTLEEEKWKERIQQKVLTRQYKDDLTDMAEAHREQLEEEKAQAKAQDREFASNVQRLSEAYGDKPRKASSTALRPKGYLLPQSRIIKKRVARRSRSHSPSTSKPSKQLDPHDDDFLPNLMEEFPHMYLAPETIKKMWMDHQHQSSAINKALEEDKRKQTKAKSTIEDAEKRQSLLMNIMQKEMEHTKRVKARRDKENADIESKRRQRDVRVQSARVKKYYDEYATRQKSSMLKNKTKEEQLFKRLFAEGLKVQKERMQCLRSYTREQRDKRAQKQQVDVAALENFYKDQFTMLAESVSQERRNVEVRDAAQAEVLNKMKKELRKKMERDITDFQDQLRRDEDDYYFRQLDAEKVVQQLNMTRYQTGYSKYLS